MKLQLRILLALIPLVTIPLGLLSWAALKERLNAVEAESVSQIEVVGNQILREMKKTIEVAQANVELFSQSEILRRYLNEENELQRYAIYQPGLIKQLSSYQRVYPQYSELRVILPDGYEDTRVTTGNVPNVSEYEQNSDYFQFAMHHYDSFATNIVRSPDTGKPVLMVSKRILLADDAATRTRGEERLKGYFFITVDLDFLEKYTRYNRLRMTTAVSFVDVNGGWIFRASDGEQGTPSFSFSRKDINAGVSAAQPISIEIDDQTLIAKILKIHRHLYSVVSLNESTVRASTNPLRNIAGAIFLGALLLTTMLLFFFLRLLVLNPLEKLRQAAQIFGNLSPGADLDVDRADEIGDLARTFTDMRERVTESNAKMSHLAYHDSLTGLPNRLMFNELLENLVERGSKTGDKIGLMFLDLDNFKTINDSLGHQFGDQLLCRVSERLADLIESFSTFEGGGIDHPEFTVARIGGDEFVIVVQGVDDATMSEKIAKQIVSSVSKPYFIVNRTINISTSIGLTMFPMDGNTAEELVRNADIAMYHAKENGKNSAQRFQPAMNVSLQYRIELEKSLRKALAKKEFVLHFQPIVDVSNGEIVSAEALIRWQHPTRGLLRPAEFISVVEETDLVHSVGEWVLRAACNQINTWRQNGIRCVPISVNVSSQQMVDQSFNDSVQEILQSAGLPPECLTLELTETSIMQNLERAMANISRFRENGIDVSMDDFGTGYSSLSLLRQLPVSMIKIDQSFIMEIDSTKQGVDIFASIITMCKSMNLDIVAEGVETEEQLSLLKLHGCNRCQGYLLSHPVSASVLTEQLTGELPWKGYFEKSNDTSGVRSETNRLRATG